MDLNPDLTAMLVKLAGQTDADRHKPGRVDPGAPYRLAREMALTTHADNATGHLRRDADSALRMVVNHAADIRGRMNSDDPAVVGAKTLGDITAQAITGMAELDGYVAARAQEIIRFHKNAAGLIGTEGEA